MSNEEILRVDNLHEKIIRHQQDDQQYLRLLSEVIEYLEQLPSNSPKEALAHFQQKVIPEIIRIFGQTEPQFTDNDIQKKRRYTLDIIIMTPFPDSYQSFYYDSLINLLIDVLLKDNEDNAEVVIKYLIDLQKFYKTVWEVINKHKTEFIKYCQQLFQNLSHKLEQCKLPEDSQRHGQEEQRESRITPSNQSVKIIPQCTHFFIILNSFFDQLYKQEITMIFHSTLQALEKFPENVLPEIKNMPMYIDYLEILKNILNFFTFLLKKNFTDEVISNIDIILAFQLKILKNTPQHGVSIRKEILSYLKYIITEIQNFEKNDKTNKNVSREFLYAKKNEVLKKYLNDLLNLNLIFGKGKPNKEMIFHTRSLAFTCISINKDIMSLDQIRKSVHIIGKSLLDPIVALTVKNTLVYILFKLHEVISQRFRGDPQCHEIYQEIFENLIGLLKCLDSQLKIIVDEFSIFKQEVTSLKANYKKWMTDAQQKFVDYKDLFVTEDNSYFDLAPGEEFNLNTLNNQFQFFYAFESNYQQQQQEISKIKQKYLPFISWTDTQLNEYIEQQKEACTKLFRNLFSFIETVFSYILENREGRNFNFNDMKLMKKFLVFGSSSIQNLYELVLTDREKLSEIIKRFAKPFQNLKILQFRDLFASVEDQFFGKVIEIKATKGDIGIVLLADYIMSFSQAPQPGQSQYNVLQNKMYDDQTAYILEIFFNYICKKMRVFNKAMENETLLTMNKTDQILAKIPTPDLQDTLQKLTLSIGEKALSRKNDLRMKNLFFSVFIFCIKYTKASKIVPYYFMVIRNLFKVLCNLQDNSNFVKDFIPMIQGLLETFLQAKEEAAFIKETNEICYSVPAKLKNLIEYLPIISRPLIDSMKSNSLELIESGINSIQMWVSALASYPEILDPVTENILPELNQLLYRILYLLPNYTFKLLGKLGAKSRLYYEDKEFKSKNFPEDGLKIDLIDKNTGKQIVLGIDSAIDVVLLKIFDSYHKYNQQKLLEAVKLVKASFICFIDKDIDMDYLIASIANAKNQNNEFLTQYAQNSVKFFDSKKTQVKVSYLGKGSEAHAFEKILKCLLIACSLPKNNPETQLVHQKVKKFFKWVTQYFTMIYICKNGKIKENLINEISPLVFIENICDFLYFNMLQGLPKNQQRSYFKGSVTALKTMIRMVKQIYGEDDEEIYENLEFIQILIQKICHLSYGQDLQKKVAANIALQIIIKELPSRTIRINYTAFMDSIFHVLSSSHETLIYQVEKECRITIDQFLNKVKMYTPELATSIDEKDQEFYNAIMDKLLNQICQNKISARTIAMEFIETICKKSGQSVLSVISKCYRVSGPGVPNDPQADKSWTNYYVTQVIEKNVRLLFSQFKGGYTPILGLMAYIDLLSFLLKHKVIEPFNKVHVYLAICEQILKILEDESDKSDTKDDKLFKNDMMISQTAKSAVKYMKMEKYYIWQNKAYDPYSHTLHPHHFLQNQHFEVEELAKKDKMEQEIMGIQHQFSYYTYDIIVRNNQNAIELTKKSEETIRPEELDQMKKDLQDKINRFIQGMFNTGIRVSDISFEYIHHLYELYPNHKLHCELISKCLQLLCDIATEDHMHTFFKERTQLFFDQGQQQQPFPPGSALNLQPNVAKLTKRIDLYAVEIKSKIIAIYFRFFQREEHIVYKAAKKCLSRILKKEANQQEALPNQILKECVRPSLNILSARGSYPAHYKQLTRLIQVLYGCFNEQLGRHLIRCYENNKNKVFEEFQFGFQQRLGPDGNPIEGGNDPHHQGEGEIPRAGGDNPQERQQKFAQDYERLILQQNIKIECIEIAHNIIKILYLLPTTRQDIFKILAQIPEFEVKVIGELERKFDEAFRQIMDHYEIQHNFNHEQQIRPLSIRLGLLKSDFREGLQKFYNKNPFESLEILKLRQNLPAIPNLIPSMLEILKEPGSFCLRERVAREPELLRSNFLASKYDSDEFYYGMKLIRTFLKFNPNYLSLPQNSSVVQTLQIIWVKLAELNLDEQISKNQNLSNFRKSYSSVLKCLLTYCRSPKSKISDLFMLIKGYKYQGYIDMSPIKLFFQFEVPYQFNLKKKKEILNMALEKMKTVPNQQVASQLLSIEEQKYVVFEMIFMPIVIYHAKNDTFKEIFDHKVMEFFLEVFFGITLIQTGQGPQKVNNIDTLKNSLESSQTVSYEQFQIEIVKVLFLIFRQYDFNSIQNACPSKDVNSITRFLYSCCKKSFTAILKEWAYYAITTMFLRIITELQNNDNDNSNLKMIAQTSEQILMLILSHSQNMCMKSLVHKAFRNLLDILTEPRIVKFIKSDNDQNYVQSCLKRALTFESRQSTSLQYLSSFILANYEQLYRQHLGFVSRINRIISKFGAQLQPNLAQKQLVVELSAVMIMWIIRVYSDQSLHRISEEINGLYLQSCSNILFYLIRTAVMLQFSQNEPIKEVLDLSNQCLVQIKTLVQKIPYVKIQFPLFNKLLTNNDAAGDRDNMQIIKLALLNVSFILIKHQKQNDFKKFFFEYIIQTNTKNMKGILFSCKILNFIIMTNKDNDLQKLINDKIKKLLGDDLAKCQDENVSEILAKIKTLEDNCQRERKNPILTFQDQAAMISSVIPHFAIRFIDSCEREREHNKLTVNLGEKGFAYSDNEFMFFKNLAHAIFRVVGYFRKQITFDQMDAQPSKIKIKHSILHQANNCTTQFTNPDLISLNSEDDIVELKIEEINFDMFNKETIMMGILLIVKKLKKLKQEEAVQILEIVQYTIQALLKFNNNEYIIDWLRKIVEQLISDSEEDTSKLLMEQKASFVTKMLGKITDLQSLPDKKDNTMTNLLIERLFEQSVNFIEKQNTLLTDSTLRLFEKLFLQSKGKSVKLKQRLYSIFESLNTSTLFKKLQFFFMRHQLDENEKALILQSQSQLLDFTLFNFRMNTPLQKTQYSSKLFPLFNLNLKFENVVKVNENEEEKMHDGGKPVNEYDRLNGILGGFVKKVDKFKTMKLQSLLEPLSEIISINPSHSTDKLISDKLFIKLFWQYWNILTREEQQYLSDCINQFFIQNIPNIFNNDYKKFSLPKTFLESLAALSPQIRMEPEVLQILGKNLNLWHIAIPILENHIQLYPGNERYFFSLNELYGKLVEEDYLAGLRRIVTDSAETRAIISYGQHHMWEEINQQFNHFIIYYAEQEGLYSQMDSDVNSKQQNVLIPGKYQRQIPHPTFQKLQQTHEESLKQRFDREKESGNPDFQNIDKDFYVKQEMEKMQRTIEIASGQHQMDPNFPRKGSNQKVKEVDLRIWETLFIESLKVLNKWDQYRDIAHALSNQEMMIEYLWNVKDWRNLAQYEPVLKKSLSIKYQLYYIYLIIQQQQVNQFDELFKQVIQLSYKEWDQCLPNYVDNVHFENLIMFQLVMECSEGGRNMIREAQNPKMRGRLADLKTAINIWRERVPHTCESIQMWKEILENRNFIEDQISLIIQPNQSSQNLPPEQQQSQRQQQEQQRQQFVNEFLDKAWNYYKLAQISRKQGLPTLALYYIGLMRNQVGVSGDSEGTRSERFKCDYEYLKLNLEYSNNPRSLPQLVEEFVTVVNTRYLQNDSTFEPWQSAELCRLIGEYCLRVGKLNKAATFLTKSIDLNKKEAKTWISYASLNQTVFQHKKDEGSLINSLKGYFSATVLNLHKSRLIIPQILKLLKSRDLSAAQYTPVVNFIKTNLDQMPTWIWVFWIPQLIQMFFYSHNQLEFNFSKTLIEKICKLYPQAIYYQLKMKQSFYQEEYKARQQALAASGHPVNPQEEQQLQQITQSFNVFIQYIKKYGYQQVRLSEIISAEFQKNLKLSTEEDLLIVLSKILCMSQFFRISHFEKDFSSFLQKLKMSFFSEANSQNSKLIQELKPIFEQDFFNEETKETNIIEIIKRLKNLKDFLHKKLSLSELKTNLEQISPYLANFNEKGVELPGQYMILETEPVPQQTIFIQKFEPLIYRGGVTNKKICIKGSNQKIYAFTINMIQGKDDHGKFCSEERVIQIKMLMNQIFKKNKETLRRGVKFYVPMKVLMGRIKLNQDDLQFANLQEIHDYLFQERGLDSDLAFNIQIKKVEEIFGDYKEGDEKTFQSISTERKNQIIEETYDEMKSLYCPPYLLSSFFHRIFYNVDDLFIFKKRFTTYHAVNSFFSYAFNQFEFLTLNQISFCKTSGRLNFNESKILEFVKNTQLKKYVQQPAAMQGQPIDYEALEKDDCDQQTYLPFRLTNNIVDFIGRIGLQGLFAGVMTSCSLAMQKNNDKIMPLLQIVFRDEINKVQNDKDPTVIFLSQCCDYIKFKMLSLSQNKNILDHGQFANLAPQNPQEEEYVFFGQFRVPKEFLKYEMEKPNIMEEFNKKVFDMIELAMNEKRQSQMPTNWNSWF